jgi:hypothetical protein
MQFSKLAPAFDVAIEHEHARIERNHAFDTWIGERQLKSPEGARAKPRDNEATGEAAFNSKVERRSRLFDEPPRVEWLVGFDISAAIAGGITNSLEVNAKCGDAG